MLTPLNERERRRHKRRNRAQSLLLLGGMVALLSACGWILSGPEGVVWALIAGSLSLLFSPRVSPGLVLRLYRARPIHPAELPSVYDLLARVCERAGLDRVPVLYYVPSRMLNAFAVGRREEAVIALTNGLLRHLSLRELAGVLAHEISHVRNNDLWIMGLADAIGRLTSVMSFFGMMLLFFNLPYLLAEAERVPWLLIALLVLAGLALPVGLWYWLGVLVVGALLVYEHSLVKPDDLRRLDAAFFTMNGVISVAFAVFVIADAVT
jgi:heat shock protein HtpX